jgi:hypothetical protein
MYDFAVYGEDFNFPSDIFLSYMRKSADIGNLKAINMLEGI